MFTIVVVYLYKRSREKRALAAQGLSRKKKKPWWRKATEEEKQEERERKQREEEACRRRKAREGAWRRAEERWRSDMRKGLESERTVDKVEETKEMTQR